jgi:hypothetical protein
MTTSQLAEESLRRDTVDRLFLKVRAHCATVG